MAESIAERKRQLRAWVRAGRAQFDEDRRRAEGARLAERLRELVLERGARSVSCYLPVRGEPDTTAFIGWARGEGIEVLLPSSREDGLLDWIRASGEGTAPGAFGIPEPLGEPLGPLGAGETELMLIPAAAADPHGGRLGWGRGFFDRNLASLRRRPPVFAIVYEHELLEAVPVEPHDVPVTGVVTPARIVRRA